MTSWRFGRKQDFDFASVDINIDETPSSSSSSLPLCYSGSVLTEHPEGDQGRAVEDIVVSSTKIVGFDIGAYTLHQQKNGSDCSAFRYCW